MYIYCGSVSEFKLCYCFLTNNLFFIYFFFTISQYFYLCKIDMYFTIFLMCYVMRGEINNKIPTRKNNFKKNPKNMISNNVFIYKNIYLLCIC